jgi:hypothetical protein
MNDKIEGIYIETAREFWGIPKPSPEEIDDDPRYEDLLLLEPRSSYDKCIVGVVRRFNDRFVLYDQKCILDTLEQEFSDQPDGDPSLDAIEWFDFNMAGAFVGEHTPGFLEGDA